MRNSTYKVAKIWRNAELADDFLVFLHRETVIGSICAFDVEHSLLPMSVGTLRACKSK